MQGRGALEIEIGAGLFAIAGQFLRHSEAPRGTEESGDANYFGGIFFGGAAGKAWRQAHSHFRVYTARKSGIAANFNLAAPDLEEIERGFEKGFGGAAAGERAGVKSAACDAAGDAGARIGRGDVYLHQRGRAQAQALAIIGGHRRRACCH